MNFSKPKYSFNQLVVLRFQLHCTTCTTDRVCIQATSDKRQASHFQSALFIYCRRAQQKPHISTQANMKCLHTANKLPQQRFFPFKKMIYVPEVLSPVSVRNGRPFDNNCWMEPTSLHRPGGNPFQNRMARSGTWVFPISKIDCSSKPSYKS